MTLEETMKVKVMRKEHVCFRIMAREGHGHVVCKKISEEG